MFSAPGKHDLVMRYSSLPPQITPDTAHAPRGLGIKVFDVPGPELFGNESTQDFTFNNYRILELRDIPGSSKLADGQIKNYDDLSKFSPPGSRRRRRQDRGRLHRAAATVHDQHAAMVPRRVPVW